MDKITPAVIAALIIGIVLGYIVKSNMTSGQNPDPSPALTQSESPQPVTAPQTNEEKIQNAMSAAHQGISKDATIMDWPTQEGGDLVELRKGSNNWTCLPDDTNTPGNDPVCADKQAVLFFQAYMTKATPSLTQNGIAYMLQGGSGASNTDPFATKPAEGESWHEEPPHVMILPAGELDETLYGTDKQSGGPWVMWAGTPYEHLMVPVE